VERPPDLATLEKLFETLYFASLKSEENQPISCRVAFISRHNPDPNPPERIVADRWKYFALSKDLPFTVRNLVKLSKAVDPWNSTLAVDSEVEGKLRIWGLIDQSVHYSTFVVKEASEGPEMPGVFQAAIQGIGEVSAYRTYVLLGSLKQNVLVSKQQRVFQAGPIYLKLKPSIETYRNRVIKRVGNRVYESRDHWDASLEDLWISVLCRLLIGIQRYGHGGAVLISDKNVGLNPKYSLRYPRLSDALLRTGTLNVQHTYHSDTIFERYIDTHANELPVDLYLDESVEADELDDARNEVTGCIRFLTSLSRVDGLIWFDPHLSLRAFGVEITLENDPATVLRAQNPLGTETNKLDLNHFGMRHRSMIRYCAADPSSIGFVISQDGDVRAITNVKGRVLLWENVRIQSVLIPKGVEPGKRA
jgi:hypothetical protein